MTSGYTAELGEQDKMTFPVLREVGCVLLVVEVLGGWGNET